MRLRWHNPAKALLVSGLLSAVLGCRHKPPVAVAPAAPPGIVVPLEKAPSPPLVVAQIPVEPAPLPETTVPVKKPRKPKHKVPVATTPSPAPVEVASSGVPPSEAIGALTEGGESSSARRRDASVAIATLEKTLSDLPSEFKKKQKDGLVRVVYFKDQAKVALKGGDAEGAETLVMKAKLLLEDLQK